MPKGIIFGPDGVVVSQPGEFAFSEEGPRPDDTVYELWETLKPSYPTGETFGINLPVKPGWMVVTFKIPGGNGDDCGLVFLKGTASPPKGTRFAIRMLPPADQGRNGPEKDSEKDGASGEPTPQPESGASSSGSLPSGAARALVENPEAASLFS